MTEAQKLTAVEGLVRDMDARGVRLWDTAEVLGRALVVTIHRLSTHNRRVRMVAAITVGLIDTLSKKPRQPAK